MQNFEIVHLKKSYKKKKKRKSHSWEKMPALFFFGWNVSDQMSIFNNNNMGKYKKQFSNGDFIFQGKQSVKTDPALL